MILGISGRKGSGKTTIIDFLKDRLINEYEIHNFADSLKIIVGKLFVPYGTIIKGMDTKDWIEQNKNTVLSDLNVTVRQLLQMFGTDIVRNIWPDAWLNAWLNRLPPLTGPQRVRWVLVGDVRFQNEVDIIQAMGGKVIRLTRDPYPEDTHTSEVDLDLADPTINAVEFDAVVDNRELTIDQTNKKVWDLVFGKDWINL